MAGKRADRGAQDHKSRLRAICERPDEDAPRLRYAEWLESTGEPDDAMRAEFIRVQCELAASDLPDDRWAELFDRQEALDSHRDQWTEELPKLDGVRWNSFDYRRGFVWDVWCDDAEAFGRNATAIFSSAPIQSVTFRRLRSLGEVLDVPEMSRVSRLILEGLRLGPSDAQALAASPHASNIVELHLSRNRFGDEGAKSLAASNYLLRLGDLDLSHNKIGDKGVAALAASPVVASLWHLGLAGNPLTNFGAEALASSPHLEKLTGLTLWECKKISAQGQKMLKSRFDGAVSFED